MLDLFSTLVKSTNAGDANALMTRAYVFAGWDRACGKDVANASAPIEFEEDRLEIAVCDVTWKRILEGLAPQLLFKLNSILAGSVAVNRLDFAIDPGAVSEYRGPALVAASGDADPGGLAPEIHDAAKGIRDEKMRNTFTAAAANCLARPGR